MKAKSKKILIIVVAVVLVVALSGTGVFFALKNGGDAVKVCLVSNMSQGGYWGNSEISDYGNVTTNMNQDIYCDDTLTITQVFVQEGDMVKAGDPLVAYDTTLLSLELEMKQMEIEGLGLQMRSVQEEIRQLRGMNPATTGRAALEDNTFRTVKNEQEEVGFMTLSTVGAGAQGENQQGDPGSVENGNDPAEGSESSGNDGAGDGGNPSGSGTEQPGEGSGSSGEGGNTPDNPNPPQGGNDAPAQPEIGSPFPEELRGKEIHTMISSDSQAYNQEEADGSAENPYRFLCAPGASVDASFMTGVLFSEAVYVFEVVDDAKNPLRILYSWILDGRVPESDDPVVEPEGPMGPTYEEIQRSIKEKEEQLKELDLSKRTAELELRKLQKKMNNGVVTSTVDGTVKSVLDEESAKLQGSPLISVVGEEGFYITGAVAETALDKLPIGMPITVTSWMTGMSYEATVTSVSMSPIRDRYSSANVSYYPFTAVIKGDAELRNGEGVGLSVDGMSSMNYDDQLYLDQAFVREEGNQYYVYKKGDNDRLTKQYVEVGKIVYGSYEILSGLAQEDEIAFPYGKNVKEGARTESVDSLYEYY